MLISRLVGQRAPTPHAVALSTVKQSSRCRIRASECRRPGKVAASAMGGVAESNKDGEFKVENLAPGKYAVYSEPPADSDWHSEAVQLEVTDRDIEGLVIKTSRGASASGVVILEGTDDVRVRASLVGDRIVGHILDGYFGRPDPSAIINPDGSFRMTGLAAGRLMLHLQQQRRFKLIRLERDGIVYPRGVEIKEREQVTGLRDVVGLGQRSDSRSDRDQQVARNCRLTPGFALLSEGLMTLQLLTAFQSKQMHAATSASMVWSRDNMKSLLVFL